MMKKFKKQIRDSWWLFLFALLCYVLYEEGLRSKNNALQALTAEYDQLQHEKAAEEAKKETLELQMSSQNDPAWVELVLMRELGLVPEGQQKVVFTWK